MSPTISPCIQVASSEDFHRGPLNQGGDTETPVELNTIMKKGTFLGVAAIMGAMVVTDAQADVGESMSGAGATRVGAIRGMEGFRASDVSGFRGARTSSQPKLVSSRRMITSRPAAYRSRSEFIRPSRRIARSEFVRPVAYRRGVTMRERRLSSARFADRDRFLVRRGEFIRPSRRIIRSEFVRPVAFRRGVVMRERRLSSIRFADRDRFLAPSASFVSSAYAPTYSSSYLPSDYYSSYNYPTASFTPTTYYTPTYYTPSTYYTTTTTAPRFTTITTVPRYTTVATVPRYTTVAAVPRYTTVTTVPRYTYALTGTPTLVSVQTQLANLGYYEGPLDGIMGPMTRSAILRYERDRGLPGFATVNRTLLISLGLM